MQKRLWREEEGQDLVELSHRFFLVVSPRYYKLFIGMYAKMFSGASFPSSLTRPGLQRRESPGHLRIPPTGGNARCLAGVCGGDRSFYKLISVTRRRLSSAGVKCLRLYGLRAKPTHLECADDFFTAHSVVQIFGTLKEHELLPSKVLLRITPARETPT